MKKIVHKIVWPFYFCLLIFLSGAGVASYLNASRILRDHTVVQAPIELVDTSSRTKKGHTTTTYEFEYRYSVAGQDFVQPYSAVNDKGERYVEAGVIKIAYANGDPGRAGALHVLERQASLFGLVKRILIGGAILGVLALFLYAWATPRTDTEAKTRTVVPST